MNTDYETEPLPVVPDDPFAAIETVLHEAVETIPLNPLAMVLATVDENGRPSTRTVLLKKFDRSGVVFFTNSQSRKGRQLEKNPFVSLTLYFAALKKQVTIEGKVECISAAESDEYFASRSRESQIGAWASAQSREIPAGDSLQQRYHEFEKRFLGSDVVPRPGHWNGYRVIPSRMEIWIEGPHRLHTRFCYVKENFIWRGAILFP